MVDIYFKKLKKDEDNVEKVIDIGLMKANVFFTRNGISVLIINKKLATRIQKAIGQIEIENI